MLSLTGKKIVVIGGSRRIVEAAIGNGAQVLAVARQQAPLRQLAQEVPGTEVLSLDAADEGAPAKCSTCSSPTSWCCAQVPFRRLRHSTSRAGRSSPSTGRRTSRSHSTSARRHCRGLFPE